MASKKTGTPPKQGNATIDTKTPMYANRGPRPDYSGLALVEQAARLLRVVREIYTSYSLIETFYKYDKLDSGARKQAIAYHFARLHFELDNECSALWPLVEMRIIRSEHFTIRLGEGFFPISANSACEAAKLMSMFWVAWVSEAENESKDIYAQAIIDRWEELKVDQFIQAIPYHFLRCLNEHATVEIQTVLFPNKNLNTKFVYVSPIAAIPQAATANATATHAGGQGGTGADSSATVQSKRSHGKGDAEAKIRAALLHHHGYDNGLVSNYQPVGVRPLARLASKPTLNVSSGSVTNFMNRTFSRDGKSEGHNAYRGLCIIDKGAGLCIALKLLAGEMPPRELRQCLVEQFRAGALSVGGEE